jgi:hypothetical protein
VNNNKVSFSSCPETLKDLIIEELDVIVEVDLDKDNKRKIISKEDIKNKI